jgi:multimeric flavodoxin WrbA
MKITAVLGSPRKGGNSDTLADAFLQHALGLGAEVERFKLNELRYSGCLACNVCKTTSEKCVLKDDLAQVLEATRRCDTLVLATPVYFADATAQMKGYLDRLYSFFKPDYFLRPDFSRFTPGKKLVVVVSQRGQDTAFADFPSRYERIFTRFGFEPMHLIRGCWLSDELDAAAKRPDLLTLCRESARKVMAGEPSDSNVPVYKVPKLQVVKPS